jgi:hypothetical protein
MIIKQILNLTTRFPRQQEPLLASSHANGNYNTFHSDHESMYQPAGCCIQSNSIEITRVNVKINQKNNFLTNNETLFIEGNLNFELIFHVISACSLDGYMADLYISGDKKTQESTFCIKDSQTPQLNRIEKKIPIAKMKLKSNAIHCCFVIRKDNEYKKFEFSLKNKKI